MLKIYSELSYAICLVGFKDLWGTPLKIFKKSFLDNVPEKRKEIMVSSLNGKTL